MLKAQSLENNKTILKTCFIITRSELLLCSFLASLLPIEMWITCSDAGNYRSHDACRYQTRGSNSLLLAIKQNLIAVGCPIYHHFTINIHSLNECFHRIIVSTRNITLRFARRSEDLFMKICGNNCYLCVSLTLFKTVVQFVRDKLNSCFEKG